MNCIQWEHGNHLSDILSQPSAQQKVCIMPWMNTAAFLHFSDKGVCSVPHPPGEAHPDQQNQTSPERLLGSLPTPRLSLAVCIPSSRVQAFSAYPRQPGVRITQPHCPHGLALGPSAGTGASLE